MSYAGFFRFNELANLKESDVVLYPDHVEIFDYVRDGAWVVFAHTGTELCPVAMFSRYITLVGITGDPVKFLFRGLGWSIPKLGPDSELVAPSVTPELESWC